MSYYTIPFIQIRSNCAIIYSLPLNDHKPPKANFTKNPYSGTVTNGVKRRVMKAIDILLQKSPERIIYNPVSKIYHPFRVNFITLTVSDLSNINTDQAHETLLKPFIRKLRKNQNLLYVWKAEFQKRGNLHYHITTNQFVHHTDIRNNWNQIQRKAGLLDKYAMKHGSFNANSTDVHAVKKIKDLSNYLAKYVTKENDKTTKSKVWDCSRELKGNYFSTEVDQEVNYNLRSYQERNPKQIIKLDRCTIFKTNNPTQFLPLSLIQSYQQFIT